MSLVSATRSLDDLRSIMNQEIYKHEEKCNDPDPSNLNFYGKIISECSFENCFNAVVSSGRTDFHGNGGDLANIYVPPNDYDTWRQNIPNNTGYPLEGEFVYQLQNDTLSCLTIELQWKFSPPYSKLTLPVYSCSIVPIAQNWDCHLDWSLSAECSYNSTLNQIEAIYTVTNLGPEQVQNHGGLLVLQKKGSNKETTKVIRQAKRA
mmetsp:Transcript_25194/g.32769  ORF Transcript_25194/g.32769 Transcript_25194/m.32769 type:complete len:206 (+) Transcript_25194:3-620(+)